MEMNYYSIAKEVSIKTKLSRKQVLSEISRVINTFIQLEYSKEEIDNSITIDLIQSIITKKIELGFY